MGIDARMLVRYHGHVIPTEDALVEWNFNLCSTFSPGDFCIRDGIYPKNLAEQKQETWLKAYKNHPANRLDHNGCLTQEQRDAIYSDIGPFPEDRRLAISLCDNDGKLYTQDGPDIIANPGEIFLEVNLSGRYYGEGYERGDIILYSAVAEWCETNLAPCEVWYGGDSSRVCAAPFTKLVREALREHLYSKAGRDYYNNFGAASGLQQGSRPPKCSLCPNGKDRRREVGWGGGWTKVYCPGCGKSFESRDDGKTWNSKQQ